MQLRNAPIIRLFLVMGVLYLHPFICFSQNHNGIALADSLAEEGNVLRKNQLYNLSDSVLHISKQIYFKESHWTGWFKCISRLNSNANALGKGDQFSDSLAHFKTQVPKNESFILGKFSFKIGINKMSVGKIELAIKSFKDAQDIFSELKESNSIPKALPTYYIKTTDKHGICYSRLGDQISALKYSDIGIELCHFFKDSTDYMNLEVARGIYFYYNDQNPQAKLQFLKCLDLGASESRIYPYLANVYLQEDSLDRAHHLLVKDKPKYLNYNYYNSLANYYEEIGDRSGDLESRQKVIEILKGSPYTSNRNLAKNQIKYAISLHKYGELEEMINVVQEVLSHRYSNSYDSIDIYSRPPETNSLPDIWIIEALYLKAQYFKKLYERENLSNDLAESKYYHDLLLSHLDKLKLKHNSINSQYKMGSYFQYIYADEIEFYSQLYNVSGDPNYFENAFRLAQGANSFILKNAVTIRQALEVSNVPQDTIDTYLGLAAKASSDEPIDISKENPIDLFDRFNAKLIANYPSFEKYQTENSLSFDQIQKILDDNSILIKYYANESKITQFVISKEDVFIDQIALDSILYKLIVTNEEMNSKSQLWSESKYRRNSKKIYDILLEDVLRQEPFIGKNKLIIIPDGPLKSVAFSSLITSDKTGPITAKDYLINDYSISYLYYCAQLVQKKNKFKFDNRFAGFGLDYEDEFLKEIIDNYKFNKREVWGQNRSLALSGLEHAAIEIQSIAAILNGTSITNKNATLDAVMEQIQDYSILHFSAHSIVDFQNYMNSSILLNKGINNNYQLRYQDILNLNLNTDLVVLSACQTGIGKSFAGEGLISLTHAFIQSGSMSAVGALWEVPDISTLKVMKLFYTNLNNGMEKSKALQKAQIEYMSIEELSTPRTRSPLHWASWSIYGQDNPIPTQAQTSKYIYILGGLVILILLISARRKYNQ